MYTWTRVIRFKNVTSMMAAMPVCLSIVEYMRNEHKQDASLLMPILGGHPARALFVVKSSDVAKYIEEMDKSAQEPRWRDLVAKLGEFVDGSATNDQAWKTVV